jgi:plastocyanin
VRPHLTPLVLASALTAVLAACAPATVSPRHDGADHAVAATAAVTVEDFAYSPARLEVPAGSTITWTNADGFAHTVTSGAPGAPDGAFDGPLGRPDQHDAAGTTVSATLDEPGTYPYFCDLHPSMTGTIVVTTP